MVSEIARLKGWIAESKRMVFFGGAGVSTESGMKDFRGVDGLYREKYAYPPETILSHDFFRRYPEEFYRYYRDKLIPRGVLPNRAHLALSKWEREGKLSAIVTQNIDGLHQAAGSERVLELHGSVLRNHCQKCGRKYGLEAIEESAPGVPTCACGGIIRPDVVLYGESLDMDVMERALAALREADMVIVAGTSLTVYPAAGMLDAYCGRRLALINRDETPRDGSADLLLRGSVGRILGDIADGNITE